MKVGISFVFFLISLISFGQTGINANSIPPKIFLNGSQNLKNTFIVFPLTSETIGFDGADISKFISQNPKRTVYYCYDYQSNNKSRVFDLNRENLAADDSLNFIIPDPNFYENLYRLRRCPFCHKSDSVISIIYGRIFYTANLMTRVRKKEIMLGGCEPRFANAEMYCKRDYAYF